MSYLKEINAKEKEHKERYMKLIKQHKCYKCVWSRKHDNKVVCMFSKCFNK